MTVFYLAVFQAPEPDVEDIVNGVSRQPPCLQAWRLEDGLTYLPPSYSLRHEVATSTACLQLTGDSDIPPVNCTDSSGPQAPAEATDVENTAKTIKKLVFSETFFTSIHRPKVRQAEEIQDK